ncbi:MAG: 2,3-bisphosphoglycerate-independent phosphoglycerate mutase, partial [Elusimicrobiota bacterium]
GGFPNSQTGKAELQTAKTPNLDKLASGSSCGLTIPVDYGITPGSGPAHLSLFGYNPQKYQIGRGVLEALGIGLEMEKKDLAARANFSTLDYEKNIITDRRAGRIATEINIELCKLLQEKIKKIDDVEIIIKPGKGHRFVVLFRGEGLSQDITENDPQKEGRQPLKIEPANKEAEKTATLVNKFLDAVKEIVKDKQPANYALMRGFSKYPDIPTMQDIYKLNPAAIATYPMYRGLAQLVGMKVIKTGETLQDEIKTLKENYSGFDFFYFHIKATDAAGEDGTFDVKVKKLEEIDAVIPQILELRPDVFIFTGDHSTPAELRGHSWHPVPFLMNSKYNLKDKIKKFSEENCRSGSLGIFPAEKVMSLAMAGALKLAKFGA